MVREPLLDDLALDQARAGRLHKASIRAQLTEAGVRVTPELVDGLLEEARDHAQRVDLEREQLALLEATGLPIVQLPALPDGVDSGSVRELADLLVPLFVEHVETGWSRDPGPRRDGMRPRSTSTPSSTTPATADRRLLRRRRRRQDDDRRRPRACVLPSPAARSSC